MITVINYEFFKKQIDEATRKAIEDLKLLFSAISERELATGTYENDIRAIYYNNRAEIAGIFINFGYEAAAIQFLKELALSDQKFPSDKFIIIRGIEYTSEYAKDTIKCFLGTNSFYFNTNFFDLEV